MDAFGDYIKSVCRLSDDLSGAPDEMVLEVLSRVNAHLFKVNGEIRSLRNMRHIAQLHNIEAPVQQQSSSILANKTIVGNKSSQTNVGNLFSKEKTSSSSTTSPQQRNENSSSVVGVSKSDGKVNSTASVSSTGRTPQASSSAMDVDIVRPREGFSNTQSLLAVVQHEKQQLENSARTSTPSPTIASTNGHEETNVVTTLQNPNHSATSKSQQSTILSNTEITSPTRKVADTQPATQTLDEKNISLISDDTLAADSGSRRGTHGHIENAKLVRDFIAKVSSDTFVAPSGLEYSDLLKRVKRELSQYESGPTLNKGVIRSAGKDVREWNEKLRKIEAKLAKSGKSTTDNNPASVNTKKRANQTSSESLQKSVVEQNNDEAGSNKRAKLSDGATQPSASSATSGNPFVSNVIANLKKTDKNISSSIQPANTSSIANNAGQSKSSPSPQNSIIQEGFKKEELSQSVVVKKSASVTSAPAVSAAKTTSAKKQQKKPKYISDEDDDDDDGDMSIGSEYDESGEYDSEEDVDFEEYAEDDGSENSIDMTQFEDDSEEDGEEEDEDDE